MLFFCMTGSTSNVKWDWKCGKYSIFHWRSKEQVSIALIWYAFWCVKKWKYSVCCLFIALDFFLQDSSLHSYLRKRKMSGFGHRVYKNYDPRAKVIRKLAEEVFSIVGRDPLIEVSFICFNHSSYLNFNLWNFGFTFLAMWINEDIFPWP